MSMEIRWSQSPDLGSRPNLLQWVPGSVHESESGQHSIDEITYLVLIRHLQQPSLSHTLVNSVSTLDSPHISVPAPPIWVPAGWWILSTIFLDTIIFNHPSLFLLVYISCFCWWLFLPSQCCPVPLFSLYAQMFVSYSYISCSTFCSLFQAVIVSLVVHKICNHTWTPASILSVPVIFVQLQTHLYCNTCSGGGKVGEESRNNDTKININKNILCHLSQKLGRCQWSIAADGLAWHSQISFWNI